MIIASLAVCYGVKESEIKPLANGWYRMPWGKVRVVDGMVVKEVEK